MVLNSVTGMYEGTNCWHYQGKLCWQVLAHPNNVYQRGAKVLLMIDYGAPAVENKRFQTEG